MLSRKSVSALSAVVALAGCATMTPDEAARAKAQTDWSYEQAQLATQQANEAMMMNQMLLLNATMVQPPPPIPSPPP